VAEQSADQARWAGGRGS